MTKPSSEGSSKGKRSKLFTENILVKSKKLAQDCVKSSPAEKMAEAADEPSLHFSGSIAQSNQAIVPHLSWAQPLNSHSNLNAHGQLEANNNLPVPEPQEPSSRINVTNNAHIAKNIM